MRHRYLAALFAALLTVGSAATAEDLKPTDAFRSLRRDRRSDGDVRRSLPRGGKFLARLEALEKRLATESGRDGGAAAGTMYPWSAARKEADSPGQAGRPHHKPGGGPEKRAAQPPRQAAVPKAIAAAMEDLRREALTANPLVSGQPILYVVRPQYRSHYHAIDTLFHSGEMNPDRGCPHSALFQGGGALKTIDLARGGQVATLLETATGIVRDPEVHFDGQRIVLALRRNAAEDYHIWETRRRRHGLRQLTSAEGVADFDPLYLPDDSIVFSSTARAEVQHVLARPSGRTCSAWRPTGPTSTRSARTTCSTTSRR